MHLTPKTTHGKLGKTGGITDWALMRAGPPCWWRSSQDRLRALAMGMKRLRYRMAMVTPQAFTIKATGFTFSVCLPSVIPKGLALNSTKPRRILERFSHDL